MRWWRNQWLWVWGFTAGVVGTYAALAWRTMEGGVPVCAPLAAGDMPHGGDEDTPLVSIIVPARDEERNIRRCVESLLAQDYPRFEVIVVDDASRDATPRLLAEIARQHPRGDRLRVIRVDDLPPGWAGKAHALHTGALAARGDWLLFTDADTAHTPPALRSTLRHALDAHLDCFSILTEQELPDFWGRVLMPIAFMGVGAQYPARQVNDPASPVAIANGQYILLRRAAYTALGGYDTPRLRGTVLDDRDLAYEVKRAGYRLELADGHQLVRTRMYQSLREHWHGWGKNAYLGSRGGPAMFVAFTVGLLAITVAPVALLVGGLARRRPGVAAAGALQVAAAATYRDWLDRTLAIPRRYVWTHPLGGLIFAGILARSGWRKLTGRGAEWRGRTYKL
ncbi:MAG TPA: glycosyltransferase [Ktedonobacterales bacterium]|jgi:chlorobactene glucosyltransferase